MPLVTIRNLSLRFRGPPLLDDVLTNLATSGAPLGAGAPDVS
jgi:hypothetical protein